MTNKFLGLIVLVALLLSASCEVENLEAQFIPEQQADGQGTTTSPQGGKG